MIQHLKTLYNNYELLWMWSMREVKIRYKQSLLGAAWAIFQPVVLTVMFTVVFSYFARVPTEGVPYPIFAYTALLPWTLFSTAISFAVPSLVNNMQLVSKIYFPREILPLAAILAAVLDFLIAFVVFSAMIVYYQMPVGTTLFWIPLLVLIQLALMIGVSLFASAINVFYRDIRFVIPLALQLWMYASPVIYPVNLVPEQFRILYLLNPMAGLINSYRQIVLKGEAPLPLDIVLAGAVSILLVVLGYLYFKRVEPRFADIM
jgi:lipopolysaccharide transport system permease protein